MTRVLYRNPNPEKNPEQSRHPPVLLVSLDNVPCGRQPILRVSSALYLHARAISQRSRTCIEIQVLGLCAKPRYQELCLKLDGHGSGFEFAESYPPWPLCDWEGYSVTAQAGLDHARPPFG